jgi:hypothetical protein
LGKSPKVPKKLLPPAFFKVKSEVTIKSGSLRIVVTGGELRR